MCSHYTILICKPHTTIIYYEWFMKKTRHPINMFLLICSHNTQCTCPDIQFKLELTVNVRLYYIFYYAYCNLSYSISCFTPRSWLGLHIYLYRLLWVYIIRIVLGLEWELKRQNSISSWVFVLLFEPFENIRGFVLLGLINDNQSIWWLIWWIIVNTMAVYFQFIITIIFYTDW